MTWNDRYDRFSSGMADTAVTDAHKKLNTHEASDWQWLAQALEDDAKKWFVAAVFRECPVPKRLFESFLRAAVYETDPDGNRQFVLPCVQAFGHRRVNERLLIYVEGNDNFEIAGAVAALYWGNMQIQFSGKVPKLTLEHATPESRSAYLAASDVWERKRATFLKVFVSNEDVAVRQQIIPSLSLDETKYPDELKPLVARAIDIARHHPDEYIRHRVEYQLGNERLLKPIPPRPKPKQRMSLLKWLKSRFQTAPISRVPMVTCEGNFITFQWSANSSLTVGFDDVRRVLIRTTDAGPFDEDVFFVVETSNDSYVIPQGAVGAGDLLNRLQELRGFDNQAVIDAMGCTDNREFLCWQREE